MIGNYVPYLHVALKSYQRQLVYRAANLAGILTNIFFGAVYVFMYIALFRNRQQAGGLTLQNTITYAVLSQSLLMAMSAFGNRDLSEAIIKGEIVSDLSRPLDFYFLWAALDLGRAVYFLIFRGLPTFLMGLLLFHADLPARPSDAVLFLCSLLVGLLVSFAFRFVTNCLAFWTTDARGIVTLTNTVILFFSGFVVPLNFFPPALRSLSAWLPFQALAHVPISLYLGTLDRATILPTLAVQIVWIAALLLGGRLVLARMVRRLTINGG